jgi:hypothetical protein
MWHQNNIRLSAKRGMPFGHSACGHCVRATQTTTPSIRDLELIRHLQRAQLWQRFDNPKPGRNSLQALVGRQIVGPDQVIHTAVYFVAYTKDHGIIEVISIRFADTSERAICFR